MIIKNLLQLKKTIILACFPPTVILKEVRMVLEDTSTCHFSQDKDYIFGLFQVKDARQELTEKCF